MAVARLSRVTLLCSRGEVGLFLSRLCETGLFHPADRSDLVQDTQLLLLSSQAHAAYSEASFLLNSVKAAAAPAARTILAESMFDLVSRLTNRSSEIATQLQNPNLDADSRAKLYAELVAIRDAALAVFGDISRIKVFPGLRRFLMTEGYVPMDGLDRFMTTMSPYFVHSEPITRRQSGIPYIPTLVVNPRVVRLFEGITLSMGVPKYNEIDPTPIVAFVFPIFFGIMFGDLGRGLVLFLVGFLLRNNRNDSYRYLGRLLLVLGPAAMLAGSLRGLFFGLPLPYSAPLPSPSFLTHLGLQTAAFLLEVGIIIGTFHLAVGYSLAVANRVISKDYAEAALSYLPTLVLYASTIPFLLALIGAGFSWTELFSSSQPTPFFSLLLGLQVPVSFIARLAFPIMILSLAVLLFGRAAERLYATRRFRPAVRALGQGVAEALVRPAELFMHTISYMRLGILLIVESIFGELLAGLSSEGLVGAIIAVPGNIAVISIMALIVYLQDLRLNVYEWASEFYSGAGKPFVPLVSAGRTFTVVWPPLATS